MSQYAIGNIRIVYRPVFACAPGKYRPTRELTGAYAVKKQLPKNRLQIGKFRPADGKRSITFYPLSDPVAGKPVVRAVGDHDY